MIKKSKQKTYYETELIDAVICDKCGRELTEDDSFVVIQFDEAFFKKGKPSITFHDIGFTKLLCEDCVIPIEKLLDGELVCYD